MYNIKTYRLSGGSEIDTWHLQVIRSPTNDWKGLTLGRLKIYNAVGITINSHKMHVFMNACTINGDFMLVNLWFRKTIPSEDMDAKHLETALNGSKSSMTR